MSLVSEVIATTKFVGSPLTEEYINEMPNLLKEAENAQKNVMDNLSQHYETLSNIFSNSKTLEQRVQNCIEKISDLISSIDKEILANVEGSVGEISSVASRIKVLHEELRLSRKLLNIHLLIEESENAQLEEKTFRAAECLGQVHEELISLEGEVGEELLIVWSIKHTVVTNKSELISTLSEIWSKSIRWTKDDWNDDDPSTHLSIKGSEDEDKNAVITEVMSALHMMNELDQRIKLFGKMLMEVVLQPIILSNGTVTAEMMADGSVELIVKSSDQIPSASLIFQRLTEALKLIYRSFFRILVKTADGNQSLMQMLGAKIKEELLELILKEVLIKGLPTSRDELKEYEETIQLVAWDFHSFLVSINFCEHKDKALLEYATNVETVFTNRSCAKLLANAKQIILRPLNVTATIHCMQDDAKITLDNNTKLESTSSHLNRLLSAKTFDFPKCQISMSICDFIDLIYNTMEQACKSSPQYSSRLYSTVRNMIYLYMKIVPISHADTIYDIPQHAALVHNNGMYLAHHCLTLSHQYQTRLSQHIDNRMDTMIDLAQCLRTDCCDIFLKAMRTYKDSLMDILQPGMCSPSLGSDVTTVDEAQESAKKCISLLLRLQVAWQNVLPVYVYLKSIGTLVNSVLEEVLTRVIALPDIFSDSAMAISKLIAYFEEQIPNLFEVKDEPATNKNDVYKYARLWSKMLELNIVLGAGLIEISDRWADGKGTLALHFTAQEAKQLIRALFQNTEKRAKVLSAIK